MSGRELATHVLIDQRSIAERVRALGREVSADLEAALRAEGAGPDAPGRVAAIVVMTGAFIFAADLLRRLPFNLSLHPIAVRSYPGKATTSQGAEILDELPDSLSGKHALIVDDIYDSGCTLALLQERIESLRPASLRTCVLLRKMVAKRARQARVEHVGFDIPDVFVVGYGLDYDGACRNLPDVRALEGV